MRKQNFRVKKINFQLNMLWIKKVFVFLQCLKVIILLWMEAWTLLKGSVIDACFWRIGTQEISLLVKNNVDVPSKDRLYLYPECAEGKTPSSTLLDCVLYSLWAFIGLFTSKGLSQDLNSKTTCMDAHVFLQWYTYFIKGSQLGSF